MVCKEDVVSWFKELESYKRIDAMCSFLNMCLPFELRFIGTYLEELGKRDFQELRGAEVRANSNADLAADIGGATTDHRTRRKMALYVSLLRSCNYACATTLYNVMVGLEQTGLLGGVYGDPLEELLLLYTMALHHPAFTFDQHTHFGEILEKLKLEDQKNRYNPPPASANTVPSSNTCIMHTSVAPNLSVPPPSVSGLIAINSLGYIKTPPLQGQPVVGSEQMNEPVGINSSIPTSNEPVYSVVSEGMPPPPGIPTFTHYPMAEYILGQSHWPTGLIVTAMNQPVEMPSYPPPPSPMVSQPSSPCDSRAGSPHPRSGSAQPYMPPPPPPPAPPRPTRRPSEDTTPPPHPMEHQQLHLVPNFNNLSLNERHIDDEKLHDPEFQMKAMAQLQSIENHNGLRRATGRKGGPGVAGTYCSTQQLRSSLHHQSSGSDSGSSTGSHSPPRQPHSPYYHLPRSTAFPSFPGAAYRPHPSYSPYPNANGEGPLYPPHFPGLVPVQVYAAPKLSCWNCGAMGHSGTDCKEPSIDEMTRPALYQLDYSTAPPDINDK